MKKTAEKFVLVAQICITFIFALTTVLYATNAIPQQDASDNNLVIILLAALAIIYVALSAYLIYSTFSERLNVKRVLLFYSNESATRASYKVVDNIVNGCAKQVPDVKVRRTKIRIDEKLGMIATVYIDVSAENIAPTIEKLRNLLAVNFKNTLGLTFNAIDFDIVKLKRKFEPVTEPATQAATVEVTDEQPTAVKASTSPTVEAEVVDPETIKKSSDTTTKATQTPLTIDEYEDVTEEK